MSLSVSDIRQTLEKPYSRNNWQRLLYDLFPRGEYYAHPENIALPKSELTQQAFELGSITLDGGLPIGLFEIQLQPKVKLERNRVGLRNLLRDIMKQLPGALVVFVQGDRWRLSYVAQSLRKDENGQLIPTQTAPKRFTYLLGKGESALTAAQRFELLHKQAMSSLLQQPSLQAFEEAFNVEKLSKEFFRGYKEHYEKFLAHILEVPAYRTTIFKADSKAARDFTKKLLGRIVFLYFLQKKGWLGVPEGKKWGEGDHNFLQNLFNRAKRKELFYSNILVELFFDTLNSSRPGYLAKLEVTKAYGANVQIPYLNGGLFENDDQHADVIAFPPQLFQDLFNFFGQYNFTVFEDSPDDHTVAVDPEMLGRIFESLLEEHRNKTGAFYTPKQVVHYMCRESLLEFLKTNSTGIDENKLAVLINEHEATLISKQEAKAIDALLRKVKICDPAIGSGAFPMGLLYEIFHSRHALHPLINPLDEFDAAEVKKEIIEGSIFGVDIETGAVDIAQLRFWLALVVDEAEPRELPNLDYKIITGNSLLPRFQGNPIKLNWHVTLKGEALNPATQEAQNLQLRLNNSLQKLYNKQLQYFNYHGDKFRLQQEIRQLKIEILRAQVKLNRFDFIQKIQEQSTLAFREPEIAYGKNALRKTQNEMALAEFDALLAELDTLEKHPDRKLDFFDWQLDFAYITNPEVAGENAGFDIVIGNPPYVDIKTIDSDEVELLFDNFKTAENRINLYSIFIEKGYELLNSKGVLCYINPNSMLMNESYRKLRKHIIRDVHSLIKLPDGIFENANVETIILCVVKSNVGDVILGKYYGNKENTELLNIDFKPFSRSVWQKDKDCRFSIYLDEVKETVLRKIETGALHLSQLADFSLGITPYDKHKGHSRELISSRGFHSDEKLSEEYVPLLSGKNITRYSVTNEVEEFLRYGEWLGAPREKRFFTQPKIIVRQIVSGKPPRIFAGFSDKEQYFTQIGFSILVKKNGKVSLKFLLGVINSLLMNFYHTFKFLDIEKEVFQKVLIANCKKFPIKIPNEEIGKNVEQLVNQIIDIKKQRPQADTTQWEAQIDALVFHLYGITQAEALLVLNSFKDLSALYKNQTLNHLEDIAKGRWKMKL